MPKEILKDRINSMWRYREMLPVREARSIVSLGEGMTPILDLNNLGQEYGFSNLKLKDESLNPTGSFKSRGLSMAVSMAKELGIEACIIPTAGNAGGALSAYCAKAGMKAKVLMPRHTPEVFKKECELYGAELILVDGLISDCDKKAKEMNADQSYFDVSTLKEPYRIEGKKTMGYEIAEQFNWVLPDVILYPTGGGTGLIGIWKAFQEMLALGWIKGDLPKMIAVQAQNCQPIYHSFYNMPGFQAQASIANGLAVPNPFGEKLILSILRASGGKPVSISDPEMQRRTRELARREGMLVAPEGGALWAACLQLKYEGFIGEEEKVLLLNTGSGYKYLENI
ncbi:MAG: threonine synthase [Bacteroidota bacterium]